MSNLNDLDPESPEYEAAVAEAQRLEDEATGNLEGAIDSDDAQQQAAGEDPNADPEAKADDTAAAVVDAQGGEKADGAQAEAAAAAPADAQQAQAKVAGVQSKDGKHVLPYAALQAERRAARTERSARERAEARAAELEQQIEDMKAGKQPKPAARDLTDEDLAELEALGEDMPTVAEAARALRAAREELATARAGKTAAKDEPAADADDSDPLQDDIDSVPLLTTWQATDHEKFGRAVALDNALKDSPKWKDRPRVERFRHVTKLVADEFDIAFEDDSASPPATTTTPATRTKQNPADVIQRATRQTPNTLSDFKGGATDTDLGRIENLPVHKMRARFADMSDDDIDRHLAKSGG